LSTALTPEIVVALCLLSLAVVLLVTEVLRIDVAALVVLVALGFSSAVPGVEPILPASMLFDGFSSNAVMSIIATMIIGTGLDRTGIMSYVASWILAGGGNSERRIVGMLSASAAVLSGFVQNIGAAALFLPVASRIARLSGLPVSRILMPMGFCVMMGGSITLVGSSSLVMLNDLVLSSNSSLPADKQMQPFHLFEVAPVGIALTLTGLLFFIALGRYLLPAINNNEERRTTRTNEYFKQVYGMSGELYALQVTIDSPLVGMTILQMERALDAVPSILAVKIDDKITVVPGGKQAIWVDSYLGVMCSKRELIRFARKYKLVIVKNENIFASVMNAQETGIAEIVVPPGSSLVGQTLTEKRLRQDDGLSVLRVYRAGDVLDEGFRENPLQGGDTLVVHTAWSDLKKLRNNRDYAVVTDQLDDELRPGKIRQALFFFLASMGLVLFSDFPIAVSLLFGAVGMVVSGVISMDEAYNAVSWKTVFLLASLIPLGHAVELSGAATWIAAWVLKWLDGVAVWEIQVVVALLATVFSLFMSNVGATVLLVPLAVNIAVATDADPAMFALTVAIATSNSFLLPTHQVNALIMGPGGYRVLDFVRAGSVMTVLYLVVSIAVLNLMY
jgi:di/tricarboxylate transporter